MKLAIVIPAYNEANTIRSVIEQVPKSIGGISKIQVIVVNDNSRDTTAQVATKAGAIVLTHALNLGAGGAVLTGISAAKRLGYDLVITLDGDGQHNPKEVTHLLDAFFANKGDLIIGSRFLSDTIKKMPKIKNIGNKIMNLITRLFSQTTVTDSQSGFRLLGPKVLGSINKIITTPGYEFCSEMIINCSRHNFKIAEVPITTIYFADRTVGTNPLHGLNILLRLTYKNLTK